MRWIALVLLLLGCAGEDPAYELNEDPRYCAAVNAERARQYSETHVGTLACDSAEDCSGNCICGGCGLPPPGP